MPFQQNSAVLGAGSTGKDKIGYIDNQQVIKLLVQDSCFSPPESIFVFRGIENFDFDFLRNQL